MKRFWKEASVAEAEDGWTVLLDQRPVRTPMQRPLVVPLPVMAQEIAAEWEAQVEKIDPRSMPMTRVAATCLDRVAPEQPEVTRMIAAYGETDLLCYRADYPAALIERQQAGWDPVLDWAADRFGARLNVGAGVMHIPQPPGAIEALRAGLGAPSAWEMTGLAEMTTISGSLVLALAVWDGWLEGPDAWTRAQIDEQWNIDQWGEDHEAAALSAKREADFLLAARTIAILQGR